MNQTIYRTVSKELTVALTAYTAGDVVGGLLTFDIAEDTGGGIVNKIRLVDEDSQAEPYTLYIFNDAPATVADDAAFVMTVADLRKLIAVVSIVAGDYVTVSTFDYVHKSLDNPLIFNGNGKLWAYLVAVDTPDYANADTLWIGLDVVQG